MVTVRGGRDRWTVVQLFCGAGGAGLGFAQEGFETIGAFDKDRVAVEAFKMVTGEDAQVADLEKMTPSELRAACGGRRPNVVFTSPPCQGNSASLPASVAKLDKYLRLNELGFRGVWLVLEAWADNPPDLIIFENVPRITARSPQMLDRLEAMLQGYGYAVKRSFHCCGASGGLAQKRRRFMFMARRIDTVSDPLRVPPEQPYLTIGDVILPLGMPRLIKRGTPKTLHDQPRMSRENWGRLALIRPGRDWRDLPERVYLGDYDDANLEEVPLTVPGGDNANRHNGPLGVVALEDQGHTVQAAGRASNCWGSLEDPRLKKAPGRSGHYGVKASGDQAATVTAHMCHDNAPASFEEPRLKARKGRHSGCLGVQGVDDPSRTVIARPDPITGPASLEDPRVTCERRAHSLGVRRLSDTSACIIGAASPQNFPVSVVEPRLGHSPRQGGHRVQDWFEPSHAVIGKAMPDKGYNVSDVRGDEWRRIIPLSPEAGRMIWDKKVCYMVIMTEGGRFHRPMTTLELAALQGFTAHLENPHDFTLPGTRHSEWRRLIGNAVPPPSARAIARECADTLNASSTGGFRLSPQEIWVKERAALLLPSHINHGLQ